LPRTASVISTKVIIPAPRCALVSRPRLVDLLDAAIDRPFTVIAAPAGYGKTSLLAQWARACRVPVAWLSMDGGDEDALRLARHLVAALHKVAPFGTAAAARLVERRPDAAADSVLDELAHGLARSRARTILVLDDEHLGVTPAVHAAVARFAELTREHLSVVIGTRDASTLPMERWRSQGLVTELGPLELAFTEEEGLAFFAGSIGVDLPRDCVHRLLRCTEGWVAGLQMAALALAQNPRRPVAEWNSFGSRHRYVVDYLSSEVLATQPAEVLHFLRATCISRRVCASLCRALTGDDLCDAMLASLERGHMFISRLDADGVWYRYHSLFAEAIAFGVDEAHRRRLHSRASAWFEAEGLLDEALEHALQAHDGRACVRLMRLELGRSLSRTNIASLLRRLNQLPEEALVRSPDLVALKAWMLNLTGAAQEEASRYTNLALELGTAEDSAGVHETFRSYLALVAGNPHEAEAMAGLALERIAGGADWLRVLALSYLGQAQAARGQRRAAIVSLSEAFHAGSAIDSDCRSFDVIFQIVSLMRGQGRLSEAAALCEAAIERGRDEAGRPLAAAGRAHLALASVLIERDELALALANVAIGLRLCEEYGAVFFTLAGLRLRVSLEVAGNDTEGALATLAQAREMTWCSRTQTRQRLVDAMAAEVYLHLGNEEAASRTLGSASELDVRGAPEDVVLLHAEMLMLQRRPSAALALLDRLEALAVQDHFVGSQVRIHVLQGLCRHALGEGDAARRLVARARALAARTGQRRVFAEHAGGLAAIEAGIDPQGHPEAAPPPRPGARAVGAGEVEALTRRDIEVLQLLGLGLRNNEIAAELSITVGTTKQYLNRLFAKLGARNRVEAVTMGKQHHLLA
jgi:LuxR family maltose regulon positive regulatory protein